MATPRKVGGTGDRPDLLTAVMFLIIGALGLWAGRDLTMGTAAAMGPGYLPRMVCWLLILVGLTVGGIGLFRAREGIAAFQSPTSSCRTASTTPDWQPASSSRR